MNGLTELSKKYIKDSDILNAVLSFLSNNSDRLELAPSSTSSPTGTGHLIAWIKAIMGIAEHTRNAHSIDVDLEQLWLTVLLCRLSSMGDAEGAPKYAPNVLKSGKVSTAKPWNTCEGYFAAVAGSNEALLRTSGVLDRSAIMGLDSLALLEVLDKKLYELLEYKHLALFHNIVWTSVDYKTQQPILAKMVSLAVDINKLQAS